jgi:hypothetical protein
MFVFSSRWKGCSKEGVPGGPPGGFWSQVPVRHFGLVMGPLKICMQRGKPRLTSGAYRKWAYFFHQDTRVTLAKFVSICRACIAMSQK